MKDGTVHFIGIGGIGMSALARILLARGERISGSDVRESPILSELRAAGARISIGHAAAHIDGAREAIFSSAIDPANPEYHAALENGLPLSRRGELLARLMRGRRGIAICGTHGKTTTTAMAARVLFAGDIDASVVLGGIAVDSASNAHDGTADWFLTEADESDGSFALLEPEVAVVNNIENDHLSTDAELPQLVEAFAGFLRKLPTAGKAIVGADNCWSASLASAVSEERLTTFGFSEGANVRAVAARYRGIGSTFEILANGEPIGTVELGVPGAINVSNALAAVAVGLSVGIPFPAIARGLRGFSGVRRRFEIVADTTRMTVIDDYAHHPTAVEATIAAARAYHPGPIYVAFQPHRYSRTAYLARDFARALEGADRVYLTPIYAASEMPLKETSERSIGEPLASAGTDVRYVARVEDLPRRLLEDAPSGALVLMLGAGNITEMAAQLAGRLLKASA